MEDGMVEIDPEQFIKCRLCIDEKGRFQLVPPLQGKIKFCFDIDVSLFDGLSQLICGKCKDVVDEYSNIKTKYQEKHAALLLKTKRVPHSTELVAVSCSQPDANKCVMANNLLEIQSQSDNDLNQCDVIQSHSGPEQNKEKKRHRKQQIRRRVLRSSSSEDEVTPRIPEPIYSDTDSVEIIANQILSSISNDKMTSHMPSPTFSDKDSVEIVEKLILTSSSLDGKKITPHIPLAVDRGIADKNEKQVMISSSLNEKITFRLPSPACSDIVEIIDNIGNAKTINVNKTRNFSWMTLYQRVFVCRYCSYLCSIKMSILDHIKTHYKLQRKRHSKTRAHCFVRLERIDDKPNLTGENNVVVLGPNKLIGDERNPNYYVLYTVNKETYFEIPKQEECSESYANKFRLNAKDFTYVDITSSDDDIERPKSKKRIRLTYPRCSKEICTSNSENMRKDPLAEQYSSSDVCTSVETSNDASEQQKQNTSETEHIANVTRSVKQGNKTKNKSHYTIIHKIIDTALKRESMKKFENKNVQMLGRIGATGSKGFLDDTFVSKTLLKHLKQKGVIIEWNYLAPILQTEGIRIVHKNINEKIKDNLTDFQAVVDEEQLCNNIEKEKLSHSQIDICMQTKKHVKAGPVMTLSPNNCHDTVSLNAIGVIPFITHNSTNNFPALPYFIPKTNPNTPESTITINNSIGYPGPALNLLNASPVANPKKAPKKRLGIIDNQEKSHNNVTLESNVPFKTTSYPPIDYTNISASTNANVSDLNLECNVDMSMPVISSTTSYNTFYQNNDKAFTPNTAASILTEPVSYDPIITSTASLANIGVSNSTIDTSISKAIPRIKCKNVSELMANASTHINQISRTSTMNINDGRFSNPVLNSAMPIPAINNPIVPCATSVIVNSASTEQTPSIMQNNSFNVDSLPVVQQVMTIPAGHIILHTPSIPNAITSCPFDYFRRLLTMHSLNLLYSKNHSIVDFVTLARFEFNVRHSPTKSLLIKCQLDMLGNKFRILIFNQMNQNLDPRDMPALWQWELLKLFQLDNLTQNILKNTTKFSADSYSNVELFIRLLKSIRNIA